MNRAERLKNTFFFAGSSSVTKLTALIITSYLVRILNPEEMATFRQLILLIAIFSSIFELGITNAIFYFFSGKNNLPKKTIRNIFILLAGSAFGCVLILYCGGSELIANSFSNPKLKNYILLVCPILITSIPASLLSAILVATKKVKLLFYCTLSQAITILTVTILTGVYSSKIDSVLTAYFTATFIMSLLSLSVPVYLFRNDNVNDVVSLKKILKFSLPLGLAAVVGLLKTQMDKLIVASHFDTEEFLIYSLGAIEVPFIGLVTGALMRVSLADIRSLVSSGDLNEALLQFKILSIESSKILFPIFGLFLVSANFFVITLYGKQYSDSSTVFLIYLLLVPFKTVLTSSFLIALGENKFLLFNITVSLLANLVLSLFLVHYMGFLGAAIATVVITLMVEIPLNLWRICRKAQCKINSVIPVKYLCRELCKALVPVLIVSIIIILFKYPTGVFIPVSIGILYLLSNLKHINKFLQIVLEKKKLI